MRIGFQNYFALANPDYDHSDYPYAGLVMVGTLLALIWVDKLLIDRIHWTRKELHPHPHAPGGHLATDLVGYAKSDSTAELALRDSQKASRIADCSDDSTIASDGAQKQRQVGQVM